MSETDIVETFESRHAQVDPDPFKELRRRLQMWATAPDSRGVALDASIVPDKTIRDAIEQYESLRSLNAEMAALSHDDYCRLSRLFNDGARLDNARDYRINEWLKKAIARAVLSKGRDG